MLNLDFFSLAISIELGQAASTLVYASQSDIVPAYQVNRNQFHFRSTANSDYDDTRNVRRMRKFYLQFYGRNLDSLHLHAFNIWNFNWFCCYCSLLHL